MMVHTLNCTNNCVLFAVWQERLGQLMLIPQQTNHLCYQQTVFKLPFDSTVYHSVLPFFGGPNIALGVPRQVSLRTRHFFQFTRGFSECFSKYS